MVLIDIRCDVFIGNSPPLCSVNVSGSKESGVDQQQQSRWRPTRGQLLWAGVIAALILLILVICGYRFGWHWTGLPRSKVPPNTQPTKTLWDWLDLLIVPVVLAIGGYLFNSSQNRATQAASERRAQDDALQAYLDHMSDLLIPDKGQPSLYDKHPPYSLTSVARARTLTVVERLDASRKRSALGFLLEANLLTPRNSSGDPVEDPVISLRQANLEGADLSDFWLVGSSLFGANLKGANLSRANLGNTKLWGVNLEGANLRGAFLKEAELSNADLTDADLTDADLTDADLREADLTNATGWTEEQLSAAKSLEGATMPNGQKCEDWLKDKEGRGEDGENSGSS
jgi:hypothetical protein